MKTIEEIKEIIVAWGKSLPFSVRLHLFGSLVNGNFDPSKSDVDVCLEFLEATYHYRNEQRLVRSLWIELHRGWEIDLTRKLGMKAHLTLHRSDNKYIQAALRKGSLVVYTAEEKADE